MALIDFDWDESFDEKESCVSLKDFLPIGRKAVDLDVDENFCLKVARFAKCPKIDFDSVKIGRSKVLDFYLVNPNECTVTVTLLPLPEDSKFEILIKEDCVNTGINLEPFSNICLKIKWTPETPGNYRQVVSFKWEGGHRLQAIFLGCAVDDGKKNSRKLPANGKPVHNKSFNSFVKRKALVAIQPGTPARRTTFNISKPVITTTPTDDTDDKENKFLNKNPSCSPISFEKQHVIDAVSNKSKVSSNICKSNTNVVHPIGNEKEERRKTYHIPKRQEPKRALFNKNIDNNINNQEKQTNYLKRKLTSQKLPPRRSLQAGIAIKKLSLKTPKTSLPRHPMPFAAKNMFYDERWIDKQERGFTNWINFILTPQDEESGTENNRRETYTIDASKHQPVAPTREDLSLRAYSLRRKMARLRRAACLCYQSEEFMFSIHKIEKEVECGMLAIRPEKHIEADLGLKGKILKMILSYNTLWLRIGLEVVYGEVIPLHSNDDLSNLTKFVMQRLLANPDIAKKYSHPTVPNLFKPGYEDAVAKFILKKFLLLIVFLDHVKEKRLIDHDPCLFRKDAEFKTTRDILLRFSCDYLKGEGDLTKHLSYLGVKVTQCQTALDEYDYGVKNIAVDLRDGVRLVRVVELLTKQWFLSTKVRLPAVSRLQKVHNVGLALNFLATQGLQINQDSKCVVDGHREKTLLILWQIIFHFQVGLLLDPEKIKEEIIYLKKTLQLRNEMMLHDPMSKDLLGLNRRDSSENEIYFKSEKLSLLLKWCKIICAHYDVKIENFTVSFSDGIAFCCLVNFYYPELLPKSLINHETTLTCNIAQQEEGVEDDFCYDNWTKCFSPNTGINRRLETLLHNEKENFRILSEAVQDLGGIPSMLKSNDLSNTIPDEKVVITYVSYLCARLLNLRAETQAARKIQLAWRKYRFQKNKRMFQVYDVAATKIQACFRGFTCRMDYYFMRECIIICQSIARRWLVLNNLQTHHYAALLIQSAYRSYIKTSETRYLFLQLKSSAIVIQRAYRMYRKEKALERIFAATRIQSAWRNYKKQQAFIKQDYAAVKLQSFVRMVVQRKSYERKRFAVEIIQRQFRAYLLAKECRLKFIMIRTCVCKIQAFWKSTLVSKKQRDKYLAILTAAQKIRCWYRTTVCARSYNRTKLSVVVIQRKWRAILKGRLVQTQYRRMKEAAVEIQAWFRSWFVRKELNKRVDAAVLIQACWRNKKERERIEKEYVKIRNATLCIQTTWRMHIARKNYSMKRMAATKLQCWYISVKNMEKERHMYLYTKKMVTFMQSCVRRNNARVQYNKIVHSAVAIQQSWRSLLLSRKERDCYLKTKCKVIYIQSFVRMYQARRNFLSKRSAALKIQAVSKMVACKKEYRQKRAAIIKIQSFIRMKRCQAEYMKMRKCTVMLQANVRRKNERTYFLLCKNAAIKIQSNYRRYVDQNNFCVMKQAAILIQATLRMSAARKSYIQRRNSAIRLQSIVRMWLVRSNYTAKKRAAMYIKSFYKMCRQRCCYISQKNAAVMLQSVIRMHLAKNKFLSFRRAIIKVQSLCRMYHARENFLRLRQASVKIQALYRRFVVQKNCLIQIQAAKKIQFVCRMYLARKIFIEQNQAATRIQSTYRMSRAKRNLLVEKRSIVYLQSLCRMYLSRKHFLKTKQAAVRIQATFRMYYNRSKFDRYRLAIVKLQSISRMNFCRKKFRNQRLAALKIQAYYKMKLGRKCFLKQKNACLKIQAHFRRHLIQSKFCNIKSSAITIQSVFRMYMARKTYSTLLLAVVKLQATFKMFTDRQCFIRKRRAVLKIQSVFQRYLERKMKNMIAAKIQVQWKGYMIRRRYIALRNNAIKLQATWRMYHVRCAFQEKRNAAAKILTFYRAYKLNCLRRSCAAVKIQSFMRMILRRRKVERERSIIFLQSYFRMHIYRSVFVMKKRAVIKIQSVYRMYRDSVDASNTLQAAVTIQKSYRLYAARKNYIRVKQAVTVIQSFSRMCLERRCYRRKKEAVISLQSLWRTHKSKILYQQQREAIIKIQSILRMFLSYRWFKQQTQAAVKLQAFARMLMLRTKYRTVKLAALCIQVWWRDQNRKKIARLEEVAATKIKATFKMYKCRRAFLRLNLAATKIQAVYRMHVQHTLNVKQIVAATKIQTWFRMLDNKQKYLGYRNAAVFIQRRYRAYSLASSVYLKYHVMRGAIITIQALTRGYLLRREVKEKLCSIVLIQSYCRMYLQRKKFIEIKTRVVVCQKYARRALAVRRYNRFKSLVITMQSCCRRTQAQKQLKQLQLEKNAAVLIQSLVRMALARRQYVLLARKVEEEMLRERSSVSIQATWRMYYQKAKYEKTYRALCLIQSTVKGYQQRRRYLVTLDKITFIQRWYRSNLIAQLERELFLKMRTSAVVVQSVWRSYLKRKKYCLLFSSTAIIQKWWRKQRNNRKDNEEKASILIQKSYRKYALRRKRLVTSANTIISYYKMWRVKAEYVRIRQASILIQRNWNYYQSRKKYQLVVTSALYIQRWYRNICEKRASRAELASKITAAVTIQMCYGKFRFRQTVLCRLKTFVQQNNAARKIQSAYRSYRVMKRSREQYLHFLSRIILLQKHVRLFLKRREQEKIENAARAIQKCYSIFRRRKQLEESNEARKRVIKSFSDSGKLCLSVLKIQRWRRAFVHQRQERDLRRRVNAALTIQSFWRGFLVRRMVKDKRITDARRRIDVANQNVTEPMKLCNRTKSALDYLLHVKNLSTVHDALRHLDVVTVLSFKCCEKVVQDNVLPVIFKIIRHGNRSLPWVSIKQVAFSILLNVAKCPTTYSAVYQEERSVSTIVEQMSNFRDKKAFIFPMACNLLTVLCNDETIKNGLVNNKTAVEKIRSFYRLSQRAQKLNQQRDLTKAKELHYSQTAWHRRASFINSKDAYSAIHMLANKLNLL